ncbi:hypothetical protein GCM10011504_24930 [Siccirubricoccus deserti]|nr:hypothetical protein GCM10011504_24930 [Siccirubricoccus deserti]
MLSGIVPSMVLSITPGTPDQPWTIPGRHHPVTTGEARASFTNFRLSVMFRVVGELDPCG